ncbi:hypothetical protein GQ457_12G012860 [Hibiscus cannabinus]
MYVLKYIEADKKSDWSKIFYDKTEEMRVKRLKSLTRLVTNNYNEVDLFKHSVYEDKSPPTATLPYRYSTPSTGTPCSRSAEFADFLSPTATNSFGTIKQAYKHQGKTNASLINIHMMKICLCT